MEDKRMQKTRPSLLLGMLILLVTTSLLTGCFKSAAPDVADTPAGQAQADQPEDATTPDLEATAKAQSTQIAQTQTAEASSPTTEDTEAVDTPTPQPPTPTPLPPTPTIVSITAVPTHTPAPAAQTEEQQPITGEATHVVKAGENLFRIALRYGTTVEKIAAANSIANPAQIFVGQTLIVPGATSQPPVTDGGTSYTVQPGDNLFRIALRYNLSYLYLAQYNNIGNPATIYVGQVLSIPSQ